MSIEKRAARDRTPAECYANKPRLFEKINTSPETLHTLIIFLSHLTFFLFDVAIYVGVNLINFKSGLCFSKTTEKSVK